MERTHLELMQLETINKKLALHIGKYDGYFGRLCLLWHCIEHAHEPALPLDITEATARRVADFMHRFLLRHALAFYAGVLGLADEHDRLAAVAGFILALVSAVALARFGEAGGHDAGPKPVPARFADQAGQLAPPNQVTGRTGGPPPGLPSGRKTG